MVTRLAIAAIRPIRNGLASARARDRIPLPHDPVKLRTCIAHLDIADDPVAKPRRRGRHAGKRWRIRNRVERGGGRIGTDAPHRAGRFDRLLRVTGGKRFVDVNHVVHELDVPGCYFRDLTQAQIIRLRLGRDIHTRQDIHPGRNHDPRRDLGETASTISSRLDGRLINDGIESNERRSASRRSDCRGADHSGAMRQDDVVADHHTGIPAGRPDDDVVLHIATVTDRDRCPAPCPESRKRANVVLDAKSRRIGIADDGGRVNERCGRRTGRGIRDRNVGRDRRTQEFAAFQNFDPETPARGLSLIRSMVASIKLRCVSRLFPCF